MNPANSDNLHPAEEHELALASATRTLRSQAGTAIGQVPKIYPGTAQERDALAEVDAQRWLELKDLATTREAQRAYHQRAWRNKDRHEL